MPSTWVSSAPGVSEHAATDPSHPLVRGRSLTRAGEISAALEHLDRAADDRELSDPERAVLLATAIECRLARGELAGARALGVWLEPYADRPGAAGATACTGLGELGAAVGEVELADSCFARVPELLDAAEDDPEALPWRPAAALVAVRLGRRTEGAALAREHLALAADTGAPYPIAIGLRTLATVDAHTDRGSLLRKALDALDGVPAARLRAQIRTDLAALLLLRHDLDALDGADEAVALLRTAEAYAGHEGLWPLLGRVRRLLGRMGEEARPMLGETLASLTAAEQRVARLAATGLTNREIAGRLVVTIKSVEWHLSRVYRKLGISSRGALAGVTAVGYEAVGHRHDEEVLAAPHG